VKITLANLHEATEQQVFDQVARHLLTQNKKSLDVCTHSCVYSDGSGLMCAAGCLMSDEEYSPDMEGFGWLSLVNEGKVSENHDHMIRTLQSIHDSHEPVDWVSRLGAFADLRGLNSDVIKEFI
jgi:hypothetical protein